MKKHEDIFGQTLCKTLNKTVNTGSGKLIQSNLDQLVDNGLKNGLGKKKTLHGLTHDTRTQKQEITTIEVQCIFDANLHGQRGID